MSKKERTVQQNSFQKFVATIPCPLLITLCVGYIFISLIGFYFNRGTQIYPINPHFPSNITDPECTIFNSSLTYVTERQVRINFQPFDTLEIARTNAWRLYRLKVESDFGRQEIRAGDNIGLYSAGENYMMTLIFELNNVGPVNVSTYCLDTQFSFITHNVDPYDRNLNRTILNYDNSADNICISDHKIMLLTKSRFIPRHDTHTYLGDDFTSKRASMQDLVESNESEYRYFERGLFLDFDNFPIYSMNDFVMKVLVPSYIAANRDQTLVFIKQAYRFPELAEIVRSIAGVFYHDDPKACFAKLKFTPSDDDNDFQTIIEANRVDHLRSMASGEPVSAEATYYNCPHTSLGTLPGDTIQGRVASFKAAKIFVSEDNENIAAALFMPPESTLILVKPFEDAPESKALSLVRGMPNRKIKVLTPTNQLDQQTIECIKGGNLNCGDYRMEINVQDITE